MTEQTEKPTVDWDGEPIPDTEWGKDHNSLLLYLETRIVDYQGIINFQHMRTGVQYPTYGRTKHYRRHNDQDCLNDLIEAGYVIQVQGARFTLTEKGWKAAHKIRRQRGEAWLSKAAK